MKKTIIAMLALSGVAFGAVEDFAPFGSLSGTAIPDDSTVTNTSSSYAAGNTVYKFDGSSALTNIGNTFADMYIDQGSGYLTVAGWIRPGDVSEKSIFSFGGQNDGVKFSIKNGAMQITAKGVADHNTSLGGIEVDQWTLVAWTLDLSKGGDSWVIVGDQELQVNVNNWNAAQNDVFGIGTGNSHELRDGYIGEIANLGIYGSEVRASIADINALVGAVPGAAPSPSIPEPTTATLSLLALAGLAARRRRK